MKGRMIPADSKGAHRGFAVRTGAGESRERKILSGIDARETRERKILSGIDARETREREILSGIDAGKTREREILSGIGSGETRGREFGFQNGEGKRRVCRFRFAPFPAGRPLQQVVAHAAPCVNLLSRSALFSLAGSGCSMRVAESRRGLREPRLRQSRLSPLPRSAAGGFGIFSGATAPAFRHARLG